ncbi:hypothetical protein [Sandaracinus amylolyticus]|uniref:Terminase B protein, putative n=1 Tax=Sandaracinus amylolyticus TaxID=927083 RepID=A0A0F6SEZ8_9BACT|nr:hypothetical protein [Sandaracinus amylolyticus]AKF06069.1 terminase B protein, putative [Sandaracinus amylolyticus]
MTTSIAREVRRRSGEDPLERVTLASDLRAALLEQLERDHQIRFPSPKYQRDPVGFFREILGVDPWSRQVDVLNAVRDYDRVAVKSGRRVSKSHTVGGIALWWYCSWPDARAIMSSTTARQVDQILWRELSMMRARAGRCVDCKAEDPNGFRIPAPCPHSAKIGGDIGMLARTGLKSDDFREIVGFTAREAEAVQGIAGSRLLFCLDEASGIPQAIYDAIEGNRAGGGKVLLTGNPTKNSGEFFDAFNKKKLDPTNPKSTGYFTITISSEESPNVVAGREVIPGLATREYIREREVEWGRESALFLIHVKGEHAIAEEGKIFSVHAIAEAEARWRAVCEACEGTGKAGRVACEECGGGGQKPVAGRLQIGLDVAGPSGEGDETVFAPRRGAKLLELRPMRGLDDDGHLAALLAVISDHGIRRETPVVVIDREGPIGSSVFGTLRAYAERNPHAFELIAVRASDRAHRQPDVYDRMRDELAANLLAWFKEGGAIVEDTKLAAELNAHSWVHHASGRLKVTHKDEIKKMLGRSPDRFDALALSVWEARSLKDDIPPPPPPQEPASTRRSGMDPYAARSAWKR